MSQSQRSPDDNAALLRSPALRKLASARARARMVVLFERVWPVLWPPLGLAGVFLCAALLELPQSTPAWAHATLLAGFALSIAFLLARGLWRVAAPTDTEADRRLERSSGLTHRPLAVLTDTPAIPGAERLWHAHLTRAIGQIGRLRAGGPHPGLPARDKRALRGLVVVGLAASFGIAGIDAPNRLLRAMHPGFTPPAPAPAMQLQAWITPPAFTGLAPIFLKQEGGPVSVPAGAHLTVNLTGGSGAPSLALDGQTTSFQSLDMTSFQADLELNVGGRLDIIRAGRRVAGWDLTVVADRAPVVLFPEPPGVTRTGRLPQTRLPWQVSHEYGVVSLQAELRLRDVPTRPPLVVAIPLPGGSPKAAKGIRLQDLMAHPWAGLPVVAILVAKDAPGLTGTSEEAPFTLPERRFQHPVARALMAIRKQLTLKPEERTPALRELGMIATLDEVWSTDLGGFLNLQALTALLHRNPDPSAVEEAQSRMWQLAIRLEEGAPERTARALEQARQALREALEAEKRGEPVDKAEIDRRMKDVQEALQKHLQALAEQARRDPTNQKFDPETQRLDARDMQRLAEQMREAAREGRMDEAREKMAELERMMEAMQAARPEAGKMTERERQRAQKRERGQQQMTALQDLVRREGALVDRAQSRAEADRALNDPMRRFQRRPGDPAQDPEQQRAAAARDAQARGEERKTQQALRRALGELMQQYGDLTGEIPPNLGEADAAMREALAALDQSRDPLAASAEQRAIEALQKGGRSMSQQMARQFGRPGQEDGDEDGDEGEGEGEGQGQMAEGQGNGDQPGGQQFGPGRGERNRDGRGWPGQRSIDRRADDRRDPLGRQLKEGASGTDESGDVAVPEQMEEARTRAIQDELRRRGGERTRPQPELDYIDRLLKQF